MASLTRRNFIGLLAAVSAPAWLGGANAGATAPEEDFDIDYGELRRVPRKYRRKRVGFLSGEAPGTIIVDPYSRYLYLVESGESAMRYGIGVGRQGFEWSGAAVIRRKAKWPRWTPPAAMVARDKFAAKWADGMPGGPRNPLGARALYLFQGKVDTLYRIHGTFEPRSIGKAVSSGCIRMLNADVADLYERVRLGAVVKVTGAPMLAQADDRKRTSRLKPLFGSRF
jgi:lipoprotein-anchoring transpeptidase ErfK/SrfK